MAGLIPKFAKLREEARESMTPSCFRYVDSGAEDEITLQENRTSWRKVKLIPRVLCDFTTMDISWTFFGKMYEAPIMIPPMALQQWAHTEGEIATAQAAANCGIPFSLSMFSSLGFDEIQSLHNKPVVFPQLYILDQPRFMKHYLKRLGSLGCQYVILTVDAPVLGNRRGTNSKMFDGENVSLAITKNEHWQEVSHETKDLTEVFRSVSKSITWDIIRWIKDVIKVKVILKGVLSPLDAALAIESGADGIIVSNHGGRVLDTTVTPLDVLLQISKAVFGRVPVLVDGGIQGGSDIIKAIALGASGVLIGRPIFYALAAGGQKQIEDLINGFKQELKTNMMLCGCRSLSEITSDLIYKTT